MFFFIIKLKITKWQNTNNTLLFQKIVPQVSVILRQLSDASTDLKAVLAAKIPKEQERVKNFRKNYGGQKLEKLPSTW